MMTSAQRLIRTLAAVVLVAAGGVAMTVPAAGQEATDDETFELPETYLDGYGWWNKAQQNPAGGGNPSAPVPLPTNCQPTDANACPAGPPADGLYIVYDYEAAAPTAVTGPIGNAPVPALPQPGGPAPNVATPQPLGPTAYGAVRFIVPEGAETQLSLAILSRNTTQPGGSDPTIGRLYACIVATPGWAAIQNGRYDQGPKFDCTTADEADVSGDLAIFDLSAAFVTGGILDVAIVGAGERPFQMSLGPPTDSSLTVVNAPDAALDESVFEDIPIEDPLAEFEDSFVPLDPGYAGDVAVSPGGDFYAAPQAPVARPQREQAVTAGRVVNPFGPDASRGERMMAVALLLLLGLALWWVGGQEVRGPRLLGSLGAGAAPDTAAVATGGIGRFARPRAGTPPRLF